MSNFQFIKYDLTPGEKYLGIVTLKAYGKLILRFKIVTKKDGTGFFPVASSYKMPASAEMEEHYVPSFMLDSLSEKEEVENLIRSSIKRLSAPMTTYQNPVTNYSQPPLFPTEQNYEPKDFEQTPPF